MFLLGAVTLASAGAACAQGLSVKVEWTSDSTANPPVQTCSASGQVGGVATIHIQFAVPQGAAQISLKSLTIHEEAGDYPDTVVHEGDPYLAVGQPCATCGDPNEGLYRYWDYSWLTPQLHNGLHDLTAVVEVQWQVPPPNEPPPPTDYTAATTVDIENLLITSTTPNNPKPIPWDPTTMTSVPITANISCCYKMNQPWTLTIYTSGQTAVKSYSGNQVIGPGSTAVTVNWDGSSDNNYEYPNGAPKGVYIFQWTVGTPGGTGQDYDQDKSSFLKFGIPPTSLDFVDSDASGQTFTLTQSLQDQNNVLPSSSRVDVYQEWDLAAAVSNQSMPAMLGSSSQTFKVKRISNPSAADMAAGATTVYLVSPTDGDAAYDKGHRNRVALQHNSKPLPHALITWGGIFGKPLPSMGAELVVLGDTRPVANAADALAGNLGYDDANFRGTGVGLENEPPTTNNPMPDQIMYKPVTLVNGKQQVNCASGALSQFGDVAIFCGHGLPNNFLFGLAQYSTDDENPTTAGPNPEDFYEVADSAADLSPVDNFSAGACFLGLDSNSLLLHQWGRIASNGLPTSLVIWLGCDTGKNGDLQVGAPLLQATVNRGVTCAAGPAQVWRLSDAIVFARMFAKRKMQGQGKNADNNVYNALKAATDAAVVGHWEGLGNPDAWQKHLTVAPSYNAARFILPAK